MRILLVGNPTAQTGRNAQRIDAAVDAMVERGHRVALLETEPEGRTVTAVAEAIDGGDAEVVVYMGGDGTFADVAKGVLDAVRRLPMGMLPSGTANNQGKSFGISSSPADLQKNLDILEAGALCHLDVGHIRRLGDKGQVTHRDRFFDSAGFGMQPAILVGRNLDREVISSIPLLREVYRDQAVYVGAAVRETLRSYVEPTKFEARVRCDGGEARVWTGLTDLIVNATPVYAGLWVPAREGRPDDGRFDVVPMQGRRDMLSKLFRDLKDVRMGPPEPVPSGGVEGVQARHLDILLLRPAGGPVLTQVDGEEWHKGEHFEIEVEAGALPIIVPEDWVPPWRG